MLNYEVFHHVSTRKNSWRALADISADYTVSPEAEVNYCLNKPGLRELSAVVSLTWICDEAWEVHSLYIHHTPAANKQTHPLYGYVQEC